MNRKNLLQPLQVSARLDELKRLKPGWLDGKGTPPSHAGLEWLSQAFSRFYSNDLPSPYLYPTPDGGVRAEWSTLNSEISLDIDLGRQVGTWHALNLETNQDERHEVSLTKPEDWRWISARLHAIAEEGHD